MFHGSYGLMGPIIGVGVLAFTVMMVVTSSRGRGASDLAVTLVRWAGVVIGVGAAGLAVAQPGVAGGLSLGRAELLSPALFGGSVLVAGVIAETLVRAPRPVGVRRASLQPRMIRDYLPPRLTPLVGLATGLLAALLVVTTATASPDDQGRPGRWFTTACRTQDGLVSAASGPYPGSWFSLPLAIALLLCVTLAALGLRRVVARPRGVAPDGEAGDDALRRASSRTIVAGSGVAVAGSLSGCAAFTAAAVMGGTCATWLSVAAGVLLGLLAAGAAVLAAGCLTVVVAGRPA